MCRLVCRLGKDTLFFRNSSAHPEKKRTFIRQYKNSMRLLLFLSIVWACSVTPAFSQAQPQAAALIPMPNRMEPGAGAPFDLRGKTAVVYVNQAGLSFEVETLNRLLECRMGLSGCRQTTTETDAHIRLLVDPSLEGEEHYTLQADADSLVIRGATAAALFRGLMTLDQLLLGDACLSRQQQLAPVRIDDAPRFACRALMIDPARHFLPVEDVKFYIDRMAAYKYNRLQLHLTDDQGWRVEIKQYPQLTAGGPFYTQEELRELVAYAAQRHIELVPELDIPGHTVALLAVFPELCCTSADTVPKIPGKTTNLMLCASQEGAYTLYEQIIAEVAALFPSPYIHLGGDEAAVAGNWAKCRRCTALMERLGYQEASQLMIPFFDRMLSFVREQGKKPVLWCELDNIYPPAHAYLFPYPADVTLVTWRGGLTPTCQRLTAASGHRLLMAPGEYAYLDYPQYKGDLPEFDNWGMPVTTLEQCYRFDPGYGTPAEAHTQVIGVMGTLWGEAMKDINRVTYMTYPRALALAEAGWTEMARRDWDSFRRRLYPNLMNLMEEGTSVRVPFEIVTRRTF